ASVVAADGLDFDGVAPLALVVEPWRVVLEGLVFAVAVFEVPVFEVPEVDVRRVERLEDELADFDRFVLPLPEVRVASADSSSCRSASLALIGAPSVVAPALEPVPVGASVSAAVSTLWRACGASDPSDTAAACASDAAPGSTGDAAESAAGCLVAAFSSRSRKNTSTGRWL